MMTIIRFAMTVAIATMSIPAHSDKDKQSNPILDRANEIYQAWLSIEQKYDVTKPLDAEIAKAPNNVKKMSYPLMFSGINAAKMLEDLSKKSLDITEDDKKKLREHPKSAPLVDDLLRHYSKAGILAIAHWAECVKEWTDEYAPHVHTPEEKKEADRLIELFARLLVEAAKECDKSPSLQGESLIILKLAVGDLASVQTLCQNKSSDWNQHVDQYLDFASRNCNVVKAMGVKEHAEIAEKLQPMLGDFRMTYRKGSQDDLKRLNAIVTEAEGLLKPLQIPVPKARER